MQLVTCHQGRLYTARQSEPPATAAGEGGTTGLAALDALMPGQSLALGAVHEVLTEDAQNRPYFFALLLAKAAAAARNDEIRMTNDESMTNAQMTKRVARTFCHSSFGNSLRSTDGAGAGAGIIVWCDPFQELYPPAVAGVPLDRLYLLQPPTSEQIWAVAECLRCKGVAATVAVAGNLSRLEARRLQLAAERGGGAGILLRVAGKSATNYAAATRWLVRPAPPPARGVQRWTIQLLHGHGGRVGQTVILERSREPSATPTAADPVRAFAQLADRSPAPPTLRTG